MDQRPSVGRIVHVRDRDGYGPRAAIITALAEPGDPMCVELTVFMVNGVFQQTHVRYDPEAQKPCTWSWPPKV